jgi:hypothetical protein
MRDGVRISCVLGLLGEMNIQKTCVSRDDYMTSQDVTNLSKHRAYKHHFQRGVLNTGSQCNRASMSITKRKTKRFGWLEAFNLAGFSVQ